MAKDRHRIFEIYESRDEAAWELMPKTTAAANAPVASETSSFKLLNVSQLAGIVHVRFNEPMLLDQEIITQFQDDLSKLADSLSGNSRVLLDFTDVRMFGSAGINALIQFEKKLRVRGSRMVICSLDPAVRASFFAAP